MLACYFNRLLCGADLEKRAGDTMTGEGALKEEGRVTELGGLGRYNDFIRKGLRKNTTGRKGIVHCMHYTSKGVRLAGPFTKQLHFYEKDLGKDQSEFCINL
jgi:hypothetical protein